MIFFLKGKTCSVSYGSSGTTQPFQSPVTTGHKLFCGHSKNYSASLPYEHLLIPYNSHIFS